MRFGSTVWTPRDKRLYVEDKHGGYELVNVRGVEYCALDLVAERLEEGWYENWGDGNELHEWEDRASLIVDCEKAIAALNFLKERTDHEYERIEVRGG